MTIIAVDSNRLSTVVKWELVPEQGVCRDQIILNGSAATYKVGAVLGKTLTGGSAAMTTSVATPCTIGTITVAGYAETGVYKVVMTSSTAFNIYRPNQSGNVNALVGVGALGTATVPANAGGLTFTLSTAGSPAAGDTYYITVTGTFKYKIVEASATDGSQVAAAVYLNDVNGLAQDLVLAGSTDTKVVALTRGPAIVAAGALTYGASVTAGALTTAAQAQLKALGITAETTI